MPFWTVIPFIGILLSIALGPLINAHWWERNLKWVSLGWALIFALPFIFMVGTHQAAHAILHVYVLDYIPFMILLTALFVVSGGIVIHGSLHGSPWVNTTLLGVGTLLASWIGTTGASMLMIRPVLRANAWRKSQAHVVIFFIFLVSNIGGALTPVGDPPLFLGFLKGVPFFWTFCLVGPMLLCVTILLTVFWFLDRYHVRHDPPPLNLEPIPLNVRGEYNLLFLAGIVGAIIMSGMFSKHTFFFDAVTGLPRGLRLMDGQEPLIWPYLNLCRDGLILMMAALSLKFTPHALRQDNKFTWGPIKEVGYLFAGIFMTIVPALAILAVKGASLGVDTPAKFFWASGILSSFLDNAPTYLTFLSAAGGYFGSHPELLSGALVHTDLGTVTAKVLMAVSAGSVFMGANSYIGNAPNFMVRSIAEENSCKMPSFFGYMLWSGMILLPTFALVTWVFF